MIPRSVPSLARWIHTTTSLSRQYKQVIFPYLKDKSPVISKLHTDTELPFNILRDALHIQNYDRDDMDLVSHIWLDYVTLNDPGRVQKELNSMTNEDKSHFWNKSVKLSIATPELPTRMVQLWADTRSRQQLDIPEGFPETMAAAFIYHHRYQSAITIIDRFLISNKNHHIYWKPLLKVGIASEDSEPLKCIASIYEKCDKIYYQDIIETLQSLNLTETFIHSWSNVLISNGDYPTSSQPLDSIFEGMLKYNNQRSLRNCLHHLSKINLPQNWLQVSTSKILARYISMNEAEAQWDIMQSCLSCLGKQENFSYDFWGILYKKSEIPSSRLDSISTKYGISHDSSKLIKSKAGRVLNTNPKQFYAFLDESNVDEQTLPHILVETMIASIRSSNNLLRSLELAQLSIKRAKSETKRNMIAKFFIIECTKKIKRKSMFHHVKVIDRLRTFLEANDFMNNELQNRFIIFNIEILRLAKAYDQLTVLLQDNENNIILNETITSIVNIMLPKRSLLMKQFGGTQIDDNGYKILELVLKCQERCDTMNPSTWKTIFKFVLDNYKYEQSSSFILRMSDMLVSNDMERLKPGNPNHTLRKIFSDNLLTVIVDKGFTRNKTDRWVGYKVVKELHNKGIYFPESVIRDKLIKLIKILHNLSDDEDSKGYRKTLKKSTPAYDVKATVDYINSI